MSPVPRNGGAGTITPSIHLEFIQNQATAGNGEGSEGVEAYHRAVFLHHHAADLERFQQQAHIHGDRLAHLEQRLQGTRTRLTQLARLVPPNPSLDPDIESPTPWNAWDRGMFVAALLGILALLVFGVLNVSFNLLESGLVTFMESPVRAYFWAALLPVGALAVKVGWDAIQGRRAREVYLWTCLTIGIAGVLVWVVTYASVYPTLSKSTAEHIASLSVFDPAGPDSPLVSGGAKRVDMAIVASQAAAEIFLSAVLGMYLTLLYTRHRPARLATNPEFQQLDQERTELEQAVARERTALAEARGNSTRLDHQLSAFVSFARSMYQKEAALHRDQGHHQRLLLDRISQQLREQLRAVEGGRVNDPPPPRTALATEGPAPR